MSVRSIKEKLGANGCAIEYPIGLESNLRGVIDLVTMRAIMYNMQDSTKEPTIEEIPADYVDKANEYRQLMLNNLANFDEDIMMAVLGGEEPTVEQIKKAIRAGTITAVSYTHLTLPTNREV